MKNYTNLLLSVTFLFTLLLPSIAMAKKTDIENYPYYKKVAFGATFDDENVSVKLDDELSTQVQDGFRDVRIVDSLNNEIPYQFVGSESSNKLSNAKIKSFLIDGEEVDSSKYNLDRVKDDIKKSYASIPKEDLGYEVSFIFDLNKSEEIDRIILFNYDIYESWSAITVEAGDSTDNMRVVRSRLEVPHQTWRWFKFPNKSTYRYWKVTLEANAGLKMNEIILQNKNEATLNFVAKEGEQYRLYYGNYIAPLPEYSELDYYETKGLTNVDLSDQFKNEDFDRDSDNDGIDYKTDNCPFMTNEDQIDRDNDGFGDVCQASYMYGKSISSNVNLDSNSEKDSDVSVSNSNNDTNNVEENTAKKIEATEKTVINDLDSDGINNIFDNCPNHYNPSQLDKDLDGIGDKCDAASMQDKYTQVLVGILIFICLVIVLSIIKLTYTNEAKSVKKVKKRVRKVRKK